MCPTGMTFIRRWRKVHNEELQLFPNIIQVIKTKELKLSWHAANMGEKTNSYRLVL